MRRVLIITYYFPPAGGPGVQRVMGMVRHLPKFGWQPSILTVKDGTFFNIDEQGLDEVPPDMDVCRARTLEPHALYNRLRGRPPGEALPIGHTGGGSGIVSRIAGAARANLFVPDARVGWYPFAARAGRRLIHEHGFDAVLTSSPPHSVHLVGRSLSKSTGIPWVADFRDPWTRIYYNAELPRLEIVRNIDYRLEQGCVRQADAVITVNDMVRDSLGLGESDATVISNGFEENEFEGHVEPDMLRFELVYVGNLIASLGVTETLFSVLGDLAQDSDLRAALRLVFVGKIHDRAREELRRHGLEELATFTGFVPHSEAVRRLRSATVPLFIGPGDILGTKIFEYIATGRQMLALAPPNGDVDRLLRSTTGAPVVDHLDAVGIRNEVLRLFTAWQSDSLACRPPMSGVRHLTRRERTRAIADVLSSASDRRKKERR